MSGDALPLALCERAGALLPHATLLNLYGSTEVAADVTCFHMTHTRLLRYASVDSEPDGEHAWIAPLGYPICGARLALLPVDSSEGTLHSSSEHTASPDMALAQRMSVAHREIGEIAITGPVVGPGYWHCSGPVRPAIGTPNFQWFHVCEHRVS